MLIPKTNPDEKTQRLPASDLCLLSYRQTNKCWRTWGKGRDSRITSCRGILTYLLSPEPLQSPTRATGKSQRVSKEYIQTSFYRTAQPCLADQDPDCSRRSDLLSKDCGGGGGGAGGAGGYSAQTALQHHHLADARLTRSPPPPGSESVRDIIVVSSLWFQ